MSYVDRNLMPGEEVLFRTRLHWIVYAPIVGIGTIGWLVGRNEGGEWFLWSCVSLVVAILPFTVIYRRTSEFAVTNRRFIAKTGLLSRHTVETALHKIEVLSIQQGLAGRWLGYGTVVVTGTGGTPNEFKQVDNPLRVRAAVYDRIGELEKTQIQTVAGKGLGGGGNVIADLERLAALRRDGHLDDDEFQVQKQRLLGDDIAEDESRAPKRPR